MFKENFREQTHAQMIILDFVFIIYYIEVQMTFFPPKKTIVVIHYLNLVFGRFIAIIIIIMILNRHNRKFKQFSEVLSYYLGGRLH